MFDLIMGIDRRMKYLDGALPNIAPALPLTGRARALKVRSRIQELQAIIDKQSGPQSLNSPAGIAGRKLARMLRLLTVGNERRRPEIARISPAR